MGSFPQYTVFAVARWRASDARKVFFRFDGRARGVRFPALAGGFQDGSKHPPNGPKTAGPTQGHITVNYSQMTRYGLTSGPRDPRSPATDRRRRHRPSWGRVRPFAANRVKSCQGGAVLFVTLYPRVSTIQIAGDFISWQPTATPMERVGTSASGRPSSTCQRGLPLPTRRRRPVAAGPLQQTHRDEPLRRTQLRRRDPLNTHRDNPMSRSLPAAQAQPHSDKIKPGHPRSSGPGSESSGRLSFRSYTYRAYATRSKTVPTPQNKNLCHSLQIQASVRPLRVPYACTSSTGDSSLTAEFVCSTRAASKYSRPAANSGRAKAH